MRKRKWLIMLLSVCILGYGYHKMPEYKIKSSISFESPSGRETILHVTVYKDRYNEELLEEIEKYYVDLNGYPSTLQMELYFDGHTEPYRKERFEY